MPSLSLKQGTKIKVLSKAINSDRSAKHLAGFQVHIFIAQNPWHKAQDWLSCHMEGGTSGSSGPNKGINTLSKWHGSGLLWAALKWYNCIEHLCENQSRIEATHVNQHQNLLKF